MQKLQLHLYQPTCLSLLIYVRDIYLDPLSKGSPN